MKLRVVGIGNSNGVIIPRAAMQLFDISHNDVYKASFSKGRIVLDKIKTKTQEPKVPEPEPLIIPKRRVTRIPIEDEPIVEVDSDEPTEIEESHNSIIVWCKCPYCGDVFTSKSELNFHTLHCPKRVR